MIERAFILENSQLITPQSLPETLRNQTRMIESTAVPAGYSGPLDGKAGVATCPAAWPGAFESGLVLACRGLDDPGADRFPVRLALLIIHALAMGSEVADFLAQGLLLGGSQVFKALAQIFQFMQDIQSSILAVFQETQERLQPVMRLGGAFPVKATSQLVEVLTVQDIDDKILHLKRQLMKLGPLHPGSLSRQHQVCGKPSCKCMNPEKPRPHGPYSKLTYVYHGKFTCRFVRADSVKEVTALAKGCCKSLPPSPHKTALSAG